MYKILIQISQMPDFNTRITALECTVDTVEEANKIIDKFYTDCEQVAKYKSEGYLYSVAQVKRPEENIRFFFDIF